MAFNRVYKLTFGLPYKLLDKDQTKLTPTENTPNQDTTNPVGNAVRTRGQGFSKASSVPLEAILEPKKINFTDQLTDYEVQLNRGNNRSFILTDNNIAFDIVKKTGGTNSGMIKVFNMGDSLSSYVQQNLTENNFIISLQVGYSDTLGVDNPDTLLIDESLITVFTGSINSFKEIREGIDKISTFKVSDGGFNLHQARTARVYDKGTSVAEIVRDLIKEIGLAEDRRKLILKNGSVNLENELIKQALTTTGQAYQAAKKLLWQYKIPLDIQDGKIQAIPVDGRVFSIGNYTFTDDGAFKNKALSFSSNKQVAIIGRPTFTNQQANSFQNDVNTNKRSIKFKTLIAPVAVGDTIVLDTKDFKDTVLKITDLRFTGTLEGNDWYVEIIGQETDFEVTS